MSPSERLPPPVLISTSPPSSSPLPSERHVRDVVSWLPVDAFKIKKKRRQTTEFSIKSRTNWSNDESFEFFNAASSFHKLQSPEDHFRLVDNFAIFWIHGSQKIFTHPGKCLNESRHRAPTIALAANAQKKSIMWVRIQYESCSVNAFFTLKGR